MEFNRISHLWPNLNFGNTLVRALIVSFIILITTGLTFAQVEDPMPDDVAPPPLKLISKEEKDQLAVETGIKDRTNLYIGLMEVRLKSAEDLSAQDDFGSALNQFGSYEGLLEKMMTDLNAEKKNGKALWSFKKLEMALRQHTFRIETVRRLMPFKYGFHLARLQKVVRKTRAEATESLFSDSVVRMPADKSAKQDEQKPQ